MSPVRNPLMPSVCCAQIPYSFVTSTCCTLQPRGAAGGRTRKLCGESKGVVVLCVSSHRPFSNLSYNSMHILYTYFNLHFIMFSLIFRRLHTRAKLCLGALSASPMAHYTHTQILQIIFFSLSVVASLLLFSVSDTNEMVLYLFSSVIASSSVDNISCFFVAVVVVTDHDDDDGDDNNNNAGLFALAILLSAHIFFFFFFSYFLKIIIDAV